MKWLQLLFNFGVVAALFCIVAALRSIQKSINHLIGK